MIPTRFSYTAPTTVEEALAALASDPGARVLAGGQSLIPAMSLRRVAPSALVDLGRISGLAGISDRGPGGVRLGTSVTLEELAASSLVSARAAALADAAAVAGDVQVRRRGTLGGAIADGHPAGDLIAAAIALDGSVTLLGRDGARSVPAPEIVTGPYSTVIGQGEILTGLDVPAVPGRTGSAYIKLRHPGSNYAICGAAAAVALDERGAVIALRLALAGAVDRPCLVPGVALPADPGSDAGPREAARAVEAAGLPFVSDLAASGEYRAHLAPILAARATGAALRRARDA